MSIVNSIDLSPLKSQVSILLQTLVDSQLYSHNYNNLLSPAIA